MAVGSSASLMAYRATENLSILSSKAVTFSQNARSSSFHSRQGAATCSPRREESTRQTPPGFTVCEGTPQETSKKTTYTFDNVQGFAGNPEFLFAHPDTLYVSGEESEHQLKMRANRLGKGDCEHVLILCETSLENIFATIKDVKPELVIIDSIQTISTEDVDSSPGSVTQIRECASSLLRFSKSSGIPVIMIGHINKEGTIAGPKILEHIVDTVIQFEGDQHYMYRILRSMKNRFGSTSELGIYEMRQDGLRPVSNPSELLLTQDHEGLSGIAISSAIEGIRPFLVETQALVSTAAYGTPQRSATGFDQRRLNMLLAVLEKRVGFKLAQKDVFVNIAGGLRVTDMAMDLSVISAVLSSNVDTAIEPGWCMAGEVGLSGEVRPINRIDQRIAEAEKLGFSHIIIPKYNMSGLGRKKFNIQLHPVRKVEEALRELFG